MAAPPSQTYRQIAFHLTGGGQPDVNFTFGLRPEDLTREEPSRLQVQQTLGGAWVDAFDQGLKTITLSGHNGWRGALLVSGEDMFIALRDTVFVQWHKRRADLVSQGKDPSVVELIIADDLDSFRSVVVPVSFTLRRSRSRPLLLVYQIQLLEIADADASKSLIDSIIDALSDPERWLLGVTGLTASVGALQNALTQAQNVLGAAAGALGQFVNMGTSLFSQVAAVAQSVQGQFDSSVSALLTVGSLVAVAGTNGCQALAGTGTPDALSQIPLIDLSASFNDVACTLANSMNAETSIPLLDPMLGASGCSSTSGGDPVNAFTAAGESPFPSLFAPATTLVSVTAQATAALEFLSGDPLLLVGQQQAILAAMAVVAGGVTQAGATGDTLS